MQNTLIDLQNHIFEMIEKMNDPELADPKIEIAKAMALDNLAKSAMANAALMTKIAEQQEIEVEIPLFPSRANKGRKLLNG